MVGTSKGQGGAELEQLSGLTVPVQAERPVRRHQVRRATTAPSPADLAKSKAGEKVKENLDKNRDKIEERLGDKLKGLLGR